MNYPRAWLVRASNHPHKASHARRTLAAVVVTLGITSASFFSFFNVPPVLGRYFTPAEDRPPNGIAVAVLGYGFWQTRYGGRADVLGEKLQIGPLLYTIIGVAPRGFVGLWPNQPPVTFISITAFAGSSGVRLDKENWWTTYHWTFAEMIAERKPGYRSRRLTRTCRMRIAAATKSSS